MSRIARSQPRLSQISITLILTLVLLSIVIALVGPVSGQGSLLSVDDDTKTGNAPSNVSYVFTIRNTTPNIQSFEVTVTLVDGENWTTVVNLAGTPPTTAPLAVNATTTFVFTVTIPSGATAVQSATHQVTVTGTVDGTAQSVTVITTVLQPTATRTPTITVTPSLTRTPTSTPSATPAPVCGPTGTADAFEPDNNPSSARRIDVNTSQRRCIGVVGDEDWVVFAGIRGKVYTIDVPEMDNGIDLSLDLYDEQGNRLAFNDDYFLRNPSSPAPTDLKPRIDSFTVPADGRYYIRVRDVAGVGAANRNYTLQLLGESYGPTPTLIPEICLDLFEPDGLPEQAPEIFPNERQPDKRLCPTGDSDWVRFFAKAGGRYILFTDSQPYADRTNQGASTSAGVDTLLYLFDRDGVSLLDSNDDIPGGSTLDSLIEFNPQVSGVYYIQVKNNGDLGSQFLRYDLYLLLCVPGQASCGRQRVEATAPPTAAATAGRTTTGTPTITPTPTASETPQPLFAFGPDGLLEGAANAFAVPAFQSLWQRTDAVTANQLAARTWFWGPRPLMARAEAYAQGSSGYRQVQYFDKARMEINDRSTGRVTNGLLVVELISGRLQIGDNEFETRAAAQIVLAGDEDDPNAPTYASLRGWLRPAPSLLGEVASGLLQRNGELLVYDGPQRSETRNAVYIEETGHNIPEVFWQFLNSRGTVLDGGRYVQAPLVDWLSTMGYPVSEAVWMRVKVGGVSRDVLVQAFERRVLTYLPDNPPAWRVEMGNVGRHYYRWRYGSDL